MSIQPLSPVQGAPEFVYKQDDIVEYSVGLCRGRAKVVGVADTGHPVIGCTYMLFDLDGKFPNKDYPYSHFPCFEAYMKRIQ